MSPNKKTSSILKTIILGFLGFISLILWFYFQYPRLTFVNNKIDRNDAINIAKDYLNSQEINYLKYKIAAVPFFDSKANRYIKMSLGFQ